MVILKNINTHYKNTVLIVDMIYRSMDNVALDYISNSMIVLHIKFVERNKIMQNNKTKKCTILVYF